MSLTKNIPVSIQDSQSSTEIIAKLKNEVQVLRDKISEDKAKMEFYTKQYEEIKRKAVALGISDLKKIDQLVATKKDNLEALLDSIREQIALAESGLNEWIISNNPTGTISVVYERRKTF